MVYLMDKKAISKLTDFAFARLEGHELKGNQLNLFVSYDWPGNRKYSLTNTTTFALDREPEEFDVELLTHDGEPFIDMKVKDGKDWVRIQNNSLASQMIIDDIYNFVDVPVYFVK